MTEFLAFVAKALPLLLHLWTAHEQDEARALAALDEKLAHQRALNDEALRRKWARSDEPTGKVIVPDETEEIAARIRERARLRNGG